ncbi:MAG: DUF2834 domain-containing protein [Leptolyngbya sp. SIO3F4]|nr:DUF2834 domain-containing protein [Leptolyngbya sp. SIO3F4]
MTNTTSTYLNGSSLLSKFYLVLTIIGSILPWLVFDQFLFSGMASVPAFFTQAFVNPVASTFATDLTFSCLIFFCFTWVELNRLNISRRWLWLYIGCTLSIGLCCSLPLFLYLRERQLTQA